MILNSKMKMQEDGEDIAEKWKSQMEQKDSQIRMLSESKDRMFEESERQRAKCKDLSTQLAAIESNLMQIESKSKNLQNMNNDLEGENKRGNHDHNKLQKQFNILQSENEKNIKENNKLKNERQENE